MKQIVAVNFGSGGHLLDHIAPLSYFLKIPLYVDDENLSILMKKYYPQIKCFYKPNLNFQFLANFDAIISCNYWLQEDKIALETFNKKTKLIFCPHGNSDKGHLNPTNLLLFSNSDIVFLYGDHMVSLLRKLEVFDKIKNHFFIGNYRYRFYKKFKKFYDKIVSNEIFSKLNKNNLTILYAPTWKDNENSSSFFTFYEKIINDLPENYNLIIKLHPNLESKNPLEFYTTIKETNKPNVVLTYQMPLVYPILNKTDIYLGDFSSVGYDFLTFEKPMYFIDPFQRKANHPSLFLQRCGEQIKEKNWKNIFSIISSSKKVSTKHLDKQKEIYKYTFNEDIKFKNLKENVMKLI